MAQSIMLVDDDHINTVMTKNLLQKNGYNVETYKDGEQAVTAYHHHPQSIILMDCNMPNMNGYEATTAIRSIENINNFPAAYIIALTACTHIDERNQCKQSGMNEFLPKPYAPNDLINLLDRVRIITGEIV